MSKISFSSNKNFLPSQVVQTFLMIVQNLSQSHRIAHLSTFIASWQQTIEISLFLPPHKKISSHRLNILTPATKQYRNKKPQKLISPHFCKFFSYPYENNQKRERENHKIFKAFYSSLKLCVCDHQIFSSQQMNENFSLFVAKDVSIKEKNIARNNRAWTKLLSGWQ